MCTHLYVFRIEENHEFQLPLEKPSNLGSRNEKYRIKSNVCERESIRKMRRRLHRGTEDAAPAATKKLNTRKAEINGVICIKKERRTGIIIYYI